MSDTTNAHENSHQGDDTTIADDGLLVDEGEEVDDGMGADAPADVAGEDEPVDSDEHDPLDEATDD